LQLSIEHGTLGQKILENPNVHAIGRPIALGDHSQRAGLKAKDDGQANKSLFPDQTNFHTLPVGLNREDGTDSIIEEIARFYDLGGLVQDLMKPEPHKFESGKDSEALGPRKGAQNDVPYVAVIIIRAIQWVDGASDKLNHG
jgi:hypothetical protein